MTHRAEDLPILGEPLPIELANSLYEGDEVVDFLASPADAELWLREVSIPTPVDEADRRRIVELRTAVRELFALLSAGQPLLPGPIAALNAAAAIAPSFASLALGSDGVPRVVTVPSAPGADGLLGRLAHEAIVLIGASGHLVRRCGAPGCPMVFLRTHHRRRWCHPSCGHRARQAAYYRRKTRRPEEPP